MLVKSELHPKKRQGYLCLPAVSFYSTIVCRFTLARQQVTLGLSVIWSVILSLILVTSAILWHPVDATAGEECRGSLSPNGPNASAVKSDLTEEILLELANLRLAIDNNQTAPTQKADAFFQALATTYQNKLAEANAAKVPLEQLPRLIQALKAGKKIDASFFEAKHNLAAEAEMKFQRFEMETTTKVAGTLRAAVFNVDGSSFFVRLRDKVIVYDAATGVSIREFNIRHEGPVAFAGTKNQILLTSDLFTAEIIDVTSGHAVRALTSENGVISDLAVSPDGNSVAIVSNDLISLWDTTNGAKLGDIDLRKQHSFVTMFSPDGSSLLTLTRLGATLWNAQDGRQMLLFNNKLDPDHLEVVVAFSPSSDQIALLSNERSITLWDTKTGEQLRTLNADDPISYVEFSPGGDSVLVVANHIGAFQSKNIGRVLVFSTGDGRPKIDIQAPRELISRSQFASAGGESVLTTAQSGLIQSHHYDSNQRAPVNGTTPGITEKIYAAGKTMSRFLMNLKSHRFLFFSDEHLIVFKRR